MVASVASCGTTGVGTPRLTATRGAGDLVGKMASQTGDGKAGQCAGLMPPIGEHGLAQQHSGGQGSVEVGLSDHAGQTRRRAQLPAGPFRRAADGGSAGRSQVCTCRTGLQGQASRFPR
jgi:hypothetical protein